MPADDLTPAVEYRDIPSYPGYRVGDDGSVWSLWKRGKGGPATSWRRMVLSPTRGGYLLVCLSRDRKSHSYAIGPLILRCFVSPRPDGKECCHNNGIPSDNRLSNLRWDTPANNQADRVLHGTTCRGERNKLAKFTEAQIVEIRRLRADDNISCVEIAKMYGVYWSTIHKIVKRLSWAHVP